MNKITELIKNREFSYSFEVTPDVQENDLKNLSADPLFFSVTWHSKSYGCLNLNTNSLRVACLLKSMEKHVLLHLSCDMLKEDYLRNLLNMLQEKGICNLFLILGEGYDPSSSDFKDTTHLIKYIREKTGQYFCIGVAGYPECSDEKLIQTKEKVDSGADFLITQACFDFKVYMKYMERCDNIGIKVPIIPGIFAFESIKQLKSFINLCKVKVSDDLLQYVERNEKFNTASIEITKEIIQNMKHMCGIHHFHFFTLNKLQNICTILAEFK